MGSPPVRNGVTTGASTTAAGGSRANNNRLGTSYQLQPPPANTGRGDRSENTTPTDQSQNMPTLTAGATQSPPTAAATPTPARIGGANSVTPANNDGVNNQATDVDQLAIMEIHNQAVHEREIWRINDLLNVAKPCSQKVLWKFNKFAFKLQENKCQSMRIKRNCNTSSMKFRFYGTLVLQSLDYQFPGFRGFEL